MTSLRQALESCAPGCRFFVLLTPATPTGPNEAAESLFLTNAAKPADFAPILAKAAKALKP